MTMKYDGVLQPWYPDQNIPLYSNQFGFLLQRIYRQSMQTILYLKKCAALL